MTPAARPYATPAGRGPATAPSADKVAIEPSSLGRPALGDPAQVAQWLVDACASRASGFGGVLCADNPSDTAEGERRPRLASRSHVDGGGGGGGGGDGDDADADDDDDDDAEDVDEDDENASETPRSRTQSSVEDDLAAVAQALELANAAVEQLQLKMVLKAGEQMAAQEQRELLRKSSHDSSAESERSGRVGVPLVGARVMSSAPSCGKCSKSFSAFQRGRNCASCGHLFCPKCVTQQQVLPSKFGHSDRAVRVCDPCVAWLQLAMDRYFDAVDLVRLGAKEQEEKARRGHELLTLRVRGRGRASDPPVMSPKATHHQRRMEYRAQRHSIAVPDRKAKPWFSGNLRALHVNDRYARRRSTTELDGADGNDDDEDEENDENDDEGNGQAPAPCADPPNSTSSRTSAFTRPPSISIDTSTFSARRRRLESSDGEEPNEEDELVPTMNLRDAPPPKIDLKSPLAPPIADDLIKNTVVRSRSLSKPAPMKKSKRKSKYARSASIDFASLSTFSGQPPASPAASDANESVLSGAGSASNVELRASYNSSKKCFDDSDIVDGRRSFVGGSDTGTGDEIANDAHAAEDRANLPATVLRFAVYDVGSKESQSLTRSFVRFGRKNIVVDRYTLEVDRAQAIVRVKSVFMHRYWAFRCDAVQSVTLFGNGGNGVGVGGGGAIARVLVKKQSGHGYQLLEWEFGNEKDRRDFKDVVEELKSRVVTPIIDRSVDNERGGASDGVDAGSRVVAGAEQNGSGEIFQQISSTGLELNDQPVGSTFPLLPGEQKISRTDIAVTLLIGPSGDASTSVGETAALWGRMRGFVTVTNFRVIFVHLPEQCQSQHRTSAVAYIPLFAIISAQVVFAGGRRPRSTRAFLSTAPPVVIITCKDARSMSLELDGSPQVADEHGQNLQATINRMAEASQRYRTVKPVEPASPAGMTLEDFEIGDRTVTLTEYTRESTGPRVAVNMGSSPRSLGSIDPTLSPAFLPSSASSASSPVVQPLSVTPGERSDAFAYFYSIGSVRSVSDDVNGWKLYTEDREFRRQIVADPVAQPFLKFYQNTRGNVCKSYPAKLLVPASMTSSTLMKVAEFRAKNRLPVITYYHQRNRCVLARSGQPLLGNLLSGSSSLSDQLLLGVYRRFPEIIRTQSSSAPSSRPIYIFDARKLKASTGNRLMGKGGVETPQDYPGAVVHHLNIANMYRMQSSYQALLKLVLPGGIDDQDKAWLSSLEATRWLSHVRQVLEGAVKIARVLELEGSSALVHCSDGWDRTAQLTSLAQIMIDPYFRTIRGFAVVVEKDWCAFGHKFAERLGGDRNKDSHRSKSSPVMFQFLDAVWQMLRQFPAAFEFDERFLLHIANSLTSGLYGTFLYDTRLDRDANELKQCTVSVWTPVLMAPEAFCNPDFKQVDAPIWPWTSTQMIRLWESYFFQWHSKYHGCRWTASLVRHHHGPTKAKGDDQRSSVAQRSSSMDDNGFFGFAAAGSVTPSSSGNAGATSRESLSAGEHTGIAGPSSRSSRHSKEDKKSPPTHKIFFFKS